MKILFQGFQIIIIPTLKIIIFLLLLVWYKIIQLFDLKNINLHQVNNYQMREIIPHQNLITII